MAHSALPTSPNELRTALIALFPDFESQCEHEPRTFHSVMIDFAVYFGGNAAAFSPKQLQAFADLVNSAVAGGGDLENAVSTCMLEHLHQIRVTKLLRPYLTMQAKAKCHA